MYVALLENTRSYSAVRDIILHPPSPFLLHHQTTLPSLHTHTPLPSLHTHNTLFLIIIESERAQRAVAGGIQKAGQGKQLCSARQATVASHYHMSITNE